MLKQIGVALNWLCAICAGIFTFSAVVICWAYLPVTWGFKLVLGFYIGIGGYRVAKAALE